MDIKVESQGDTITVRIKGKITFECCPELQKSLDSALKDGIREVRIDFREVPFIDSSGVGEVLRLFKRLRETGGSLLLMNPNKKLRDLFLMYRFDKFMKIIDETEPE